MYLCTYLNFKHIDYYTIYDEKDFKHDVSTWLLHTCLCGRYGNK